MALASVDILSWFEDEDQLPRPIESGPVITYDDVCHDAECIRLFRRACAGNQEADIKLRMRLYDLSPKWERKEMRAGFSNDVESADPYYRDEVIPTKPRNRMRAFKRAV
jgi:hypothetical protein